MGGRRPICQQVAVTQKGVRRGPDPEKLEDGRAVTEGRGTCRQRDRWPP